MEVPLLEIVPLELKPYLRTCFRFVAMLAIVTWLCFLPSIFGAFGGSSERLLWAAGMLAVFCEFAFVCPMFIMCHVMRESERTVWAEVRTLLKWSAFGAGIFMMAVILIEIVSPLLDAVHLSSGIVICAAALGVLIAAGIYNFVFFKVWIRTYMKRDFDVEPRDLWGRYLSLFPEWCGGR